ncbi:hypothetical protein GCM10011410_13810 [Hoyosella rhizosphaerae]|uniref:Uncharacterized protein n=2 Tax=Hoyosella rhizosphaerae TaxID=1755582 RepID=A0A916U958_9ACTN|nr:hypothetical protein GCM10011410_13810 [Hoyosella rhizosphaerae]
MATEIAENWAHGANEWALEVREGVVDVFGGVTWKPGSSDEPAAAIVFVLGTIPREEEILAVQRLRETLPEEENVLLVQGRADVIAAHHCDDTDVSPSSARQRTHSPLPARTMEVIPVSAKLAQASRKLNTSDLDALRSLARQEAADTSEHTNRAVRWYSADLFRRNTDVLSSAQSERLLDLLDLPGMRHAIEALRKSPTMTLKKMGELMHHHSGIAPMHRWLQHALWALSTQRASNSSSRHNAKINVAWAPERAPEGPTTRTDLLATAAQVRATAVAAATATEARAAHAHYRHLLAAAEELAS